MMYISTSCKLFFIHFLYQFVNCAILHTKQGMLKGTEELSRDGRPFYAFYNIPYAEPPIGDLRFKNPIPAKSWNGMRDAAILPPPCISMEYGEMSGSEDCLYLNVYTPKMSNDSLLPVMLFIYGGRFLNGHILPDRYGAQYFMDQDIILITFHYRLGVLGFLSTEDEIIPGNYGLKDVIAALEWIQKYIEAFGGDKNRVTLCGASSGAISSSLTLISPLGKGLFHRVISQSGHPFEIEKPGRARKTVWNFASIVGCNNETIKTSETLLECLMQLPAEKLTENSLKLYSFGNLLPAFLWGPVIEDEKVPGAFLVDEPSKLLSRKTNIPWMLGINSNDGGMLTLFIYCNPSFSVLEQLEKNYKQYFPELFNYDYETDNTERLDFLTETYKNHYFGDKSIRENIHGFSKMMTFLKYLRGVGKIVKLYKGPKYLYYYDHRTKETFAVEFGKCDEEMGVVHGDELISMFNRSSAPRITPVTEGIDLVVSKQFLQLLTNFAAKGDPNDDGRHLWTTVKSTDEFNYLKIKDGLLKMENDYLQSEIHFIENVLMKSFQ